MALVTGAARGIGRACALELAAGAAETVREFEALGQRPFAVDCDVSDRAAVERMVADTAERLGRLDILVINAGKGDRQPFLELDPEAVRRTMDIIFWGAFHAGQFAARRMVAEAASSW